MVKEKSESFIDNFYNLKKVFYRFSLETIMKNKSVETFNAILNVEFSPSCDLLAISFG